MLPSIPASSAAHCPKDAGTGPALWGPVASPAKQLEDLILTLGGSPQSWKSCFAVFEKYAFCQLKFTANFKEMMGKRAA